VGAVYVSGDIVASVCQHAIARRFQRGFNTTDEAILSELRQIALCHATIVEALGDFSIVLRRRFVGW
jgi:hypothetical protein